jgi:Transposase and inactivated derivatives
MSIPKRNSEQTSIQEGLRTFFVSTNSEGKKALFQVEENARLLIETLFLYRSQKKYLLHEFVVMKNHLHVLLTINNELSIERAVQFIKGGYSFRLKKELGKPFEVWQRGFSETRITTQLCLKNTGNTSTRIQ